MTKRKKLPPAAIMVMIVDDDFPFNAEEHRLVISRRYIKFFKKEIEKIRHMYRKDRADAMKSLVVEAHNCRQLDLETHLTYIAETMSNMNEPVIIIKGTEGIDEPKS